MAQMAGMIAMLQRLGVIAALIAAAPVWAQDPQAAAAEDPPSSWRFLDGPGATGVLRLADEIGPDARGFFVLRVDGRGVFEGVYNLKDDARSAVGMFWPEGRLNNDAVSGFLDLDADGAAVITFTDGGGVDGLTAR